MAKVSLSGNMKEQKPEPTDDAAALEESQAGPFVCVSRQFGCYGFSLGLLMMEILNDTADAAGTWKIYHREILERLATETDLATELLEHQRHTRPRLLVDFFRSFSRERVPSGLEVRRRIAMIIRGLAIEGHAIIIGQGGSAATQDLPNGLSVRLEAPLEWRAKEVAFREGLSETKSKLMIKERDRQRRRLSKFYSVRSHSTLAYSVIYDCSVFTLAQIAQHVVYAMKLRKCL